ncbi:hypothetical protein C8R45DRAFT_928181 [Mycena sanguinolenta]|nr:hypothetical protein C8R45DRAFT_928181 [Mycena sanguinolenta]
MKLSFLLFLFGTTIFSTHAADPDVVPSGFLVPQCTVLEVAWKQPHLHVQPSNLINVTNLVDLGIQNGTSTTFPVTLKIGQNFTFAYNTIADQFTVFVCFGGKHQLSARTKLRVGTQQWGKSITEHSSSASQSSSGQSSVPSSEASQSLSSTSSASSESSASQSSSSTSTSASSSPSVGSGSAKAFPVGAVAGSVSALAVIILLYVELSGLTMWPTPKMIVKLVARIYVALFK